MTERFVEFVEHLLNTSCDTHLKDMVSTNKKEIIKVLDLYKEWEVVTSFFDEEYALYDPPGCFQ